VGRFPEPLQAPVEGKVRERQMSAPPPPESEEGLRREGNLIAAIRAMKPEERAKLRDKDNVVDEELAGAILRSHHVAVGMTQNEQASFRIAWQRQKFPGHAEHLNRLNRTLAHIQRAVPILTSYAEKRANSLAGGLRTSRE